MLPTPYKIIILLGTALLLVSGLNAVSVQAQNHIAKSLDTDSLGVEISPLSNPIYHQPPSPIGGLLLSSLWITEGSPNDNFIWDDFTFTSAQDITEIHWVGGYDPAFSGSVGAVFDFTVSIYPSTADGSQPDLPNPLVNYQTVGNAGESYAGTVGGVAIYHYSYVLPVKFTVTAGEKYWIQIEGRQKGYPNWGLAKGFSGDHCSLMKVNGKNEPYQIVQEDAAFTLLGPTSSGLYPNLMAGTSKQ